MPRSRRKSELLAKYHYPRNRTRRSFLRGGIGALAWLLLDYQIEGKENLPEDGPLLIVGNHFHFLDTIGPIHVTKYPLEFINDAEMPMAPGIVKFLPGWWGTLKITQGRPNLEAIRAAETILQQNGVLAIFPEGHVHKPPLGNPLPGAAFLGLRLGVPIVPVGTYSEDDWDIFGTLLHKKRKARVVTRIGKPFGPLADGDPTCVPGREDVKNAGQEIMRQIANLLPKSARGPYLQEASSGL
ncbi:MAG: lysophospholipid acyltransferase family protein [Anaerolineaceae bacterium]|jgi:1-acyl-sn-glycerol-3-phosphate acyltransferase|nr:lysophospholipid acyltransferase family protein [Anaerolineaceae bacterium]